MWSILQRKRQNGGSLFSNSVVNDRQPKVRKSLWRVTKTKPIFFVLMALGVASVWYGVTKTIFFHLARTAFTGVTVTDKPDHKIAFPFSEVSDTSYVLTQSEIEWLREEALISNNDPVIFDPSFPYRSPYGKMNLSGASAPYVRPPPRSVKPFKDDKLFAKVQECLRDSPFISHEMRQKPVLIDHKYELPADIEDHYAEMLRVTDNLRHLKWHYYGGYSGPWIENLFISNFCCDRPLSAFGGLVPLFVQWTDLWHIGDWFNERHLEFPEFKLFLSKLRHDVIYVTVSQHDTGIFNSGRALHPSRNWNILTLSSGGFGNIPMPLMSGHLKLVGLDTEAWSLFIFAGRFFSYSTRHKMRAVFEKLQHRDMGFNYQLYQGPRWREVMKTGLLNVIPRGFGRSSFRMAEVIQMGFIPVYLYDDDDWSPYKGTLAHMSRFGYVMRDSQFEAFAEQVFENFQANKTKVIASLKVKYEMLKAVRDLYTFPGVLRQLEYFFRDNPKGLLMCQRMPARFN